MTVTKQSLHEDLKAAGLRHDDTVLVHSSASAIGAGTEEILDALEEYFCEEGLLVIPAMTYTLIHPWDAESERCRKCQCPRKYCFAYGKGLHDTRVFTPTMPTCIGGIPNAFLKRQGVFRSLSITSSVAAKGHDAKTFTAGHELCESGCSKGSPWEKLIGRNAKILMLGVPITRMTCLHGVAEWARPDSFLPPPFQMPVEVIGHDGKHIESRECRPVSGYSGAFSSLEAPLRQSGALTDFVFGNALSLLGDARLIWKTAEPIVRRNPELL